MLLACGFMGVAPAQPGAAPADLAPSRDPELRQIDAVKDAPALARLEHIRATLPEEYRKRNNFAWAVAKIHGLKKVEYFAHSGIQDLDGLSAKAAKAIKEISVKPSKKAKFKTLCVNQNGAVEGADCWQRDVDTEFKILEDIAARLKDTAVSGRIRLYTELYPCPSCWNVMKQFLALYPNVQMQVLYRKD
jgi:hypothetical protein